MRPRALLSWAAGPILDFSVGRGGGRMPEFRLIVHRGGRPANTLEGARASCAAGARDLELDVRQTADGAWVCWHDADLTRAAGIDRRIADLPLRRLRRLVPLTTLEELLDGVPPQARLWLEVKGWTKPDAAARLAALARPLSREKRLVVMSFSEPFLRAARSADEDLDLGCLTIWRRGCVRRAAALRARALLPLAIQPGLRGLIAAARARGLEVYPYTVDGARQAARLAAWGAHGVVTNAWRA